jgi:signal transduction histidine kinase
MLHIGAVRTRPPVLFILGFLAVALAAILSVQALALVRERAGWRERVAAVELDGIARATALRTEYQLVTPIATELTRATNGAPTITEFASRARRNLLTCACVGPNPAIVHVHRDARHAEMVGGDTALDRWVADTLSRQVLLPHLATGRVIGHARDSAQIVFGFVATSPPVPVHMVAYAAYLIAGALQDLYAIELEPAPYLSRATADSTVMAEDTGLFAFDRSRVTLGIRDAAGRDLYDSPGLRWTPGLRVRTLPPDVGRFDLRIYAARDPALIPPAGGAGLLLVIALFGITAALFVLALLQLRAEHELARRRARFVSGVSHDLRTPLTQIRLFAELLRDDRPAVQAKRYEYARIIDEETQRLTYLVDNVLAFSALEHEAGALRRHPVPLSDVVRDTVERFMPLATSRSVSIHTAVPDGVTVCGDPDAFRRILLNVLDNAVKYGPNGQRIDVALAVHDRTAVLTVDDAGAGIPAADRMRVFEPFVRLENGHGSGVGGSGIGLAIVRDLVTALGGSVGLTDAPFGGTRVQLTFPV